MAKGTGTGKGTVSASVVPNEKERAFAASWMRERPVGCRVQGAGCRVQGAGCRVP